MLFYFPVDITMSIFFLIKIIHQHREQVCSHTSEEGRKSQNFHHFPVACIRKIFLFCCSYGIVAKNTKTTACFFLPAQLMSITSMRMVINIKCLLNEMRSFFKNKTKGLHVNAVKQVYA